MDEPSQKILTYFKDERILKLRGSSFNLYHDGQLAEILTNFMDYLNVDISQCSHGFEHSEVGFETGR